MIAARVPKGRAVAMAAAAHAVGRNAAATTTSRMPAAHMATRSGSLGDVILADSLSFVSVEYRLIASYLVELLMAGRFDLRSRCYTMMADSSQAGSDELLAIPRLAERVGVTPRVLRYWEEQGLISPTREHGKLRYSPRDVAIAGLIRRLLAAGVGIEGVRMLKRLAERDIRRGAGAEDETALLEEALRILYQRKAFREETGMDEEHYPEGKPPPPPPHHRPPR
jgi:DNA-binding transcriptional MerR regulator